MDVSLLAAFGIPIRKDAGKNPASCDVSLNG